MARSTGCERAFCNSRKRTPAGKRASHSAEDSLRLFYQDDDRAYEELDRRHRHRLAGLARWRLGGLADADERACEVTQETLLRVVRTRADGLSRWQPERGPVRPWLDT